MRNLTVAIQLITKEIGDNNRFGAQLTKNGSGGGLIALYDGVLFLCLSRKCAVHHKFSENPAHQVCPGTIRKIAVSGFRKRLFNHPTAGGFPIGTGDGDRPDGSGEPGEQIGTELHGETTGHCRPASVQKPGDPSQNFTDQDRKNRAKRDLHTYFLVQKQNERIIPCNDDEGK